MQILMFPCPFLPSCYMHVMLLKVACVLVIEFLIELLLMLLARREKAKIKVNSVPVFTRQISFLYYLIHFHILTQVWICLGLRLVWLEFILEVRQCLVHGLSSR